MLVFCCIFAIFAITVTIFKIWYSDINHAVNCTTYGADIVWHKRQASLNVWKGNAQLEEARQTSQTEADVEADFDTRPADNS